MAKPKKGTLAYDFAREKKSTEDFVSEIEAQSARAGLKTNVALGEKLGLTYQCIGKYKKQPEIIRLGTMKKLVKAIAPDAGVVLRFLGYSDTQIHDFAEREAQ